MKTIRKKGNPKSCYSLHDQYINKIQIVDDNVELFFDEGFYDLKKQQKTNSSKIIIQNVDLDFCFVYILSNYGKFNRFVGEKLLLENFLKKYEKYRIEIVDELYGYNQISICGYLSKENKTVLKEIELSFYYFGDLIYEV